MNVCNLNYLKSLSPDNPRFVMEMIQLFLKQIPMSVKAMNQCLATADWAGLQYNTHKIRSHIDCMGIQKEYKDTAKQIEEYAKLQEHLDLIPGLLLKIETIFQQASKELKVELNKNYRNIIQRTG